MSRFLPAYWVGNVLAGGVGWLFNGWYGAVIGLVVWNGIVFASVMFGD